MIDLKVEIESIGSFVEAIDSEVTCIYRTPNSYTPNEILIRFIAGESQSETSYHYRLDHTFQVIYFGATELDCLTKMSAITRVMNTENFIPIVGQMNEARYLRIGSFSLSQPFKTEGGLYAVIGILNVNLREARPQKQYEKIGEVIATITPKGD